MVGTLLNSLLRHADRVAIGCQAQLVNVIGLLRSEPAGAAWKQTIALPFEQVRRHAAGEVLSVRTRGDRHDSDAYGDVPVVDAGATWDEETGSLALFVANRSTADPSALTADLLGFGALRVVDARVLAAAPGQDRHVCNDATDPERVRLWTLDGVVVDGGTLTAQLPPLSWAVVRLAGRALAG